MSAAPQKPVLALDLDDIIYPFMDGIVPELNAAFGVNTGVEDYFTYDFEDVLGVTRQQVIDVVVDYFENVGNNHPDPCDGALAAIDALNSRFRLVIITSRQDSLHQLTTDWLMHHFADRFESVHLCNSYVVVDPSAPRKKADVCEQLGAVALVDDNLAHVTDVARRGMKGIVFGNFAWNRTDTLPDGVVRAEDWDAVIRELETTWP